MSISFDPALIKRMKSMIVKLTEADIAYYRDDNPIMGDRE